MSVIPIDICRWSYSLCFCALRLKQRECIMIFRVCSLSAEVANGKPRADLSLHACLPLLGWNWPTWYFNTFWMSYWHLNTWEFFFFLKSFRFSAALTTGSIFFLGRHGPNWESRGYLYERRCQLMESSPHAAACTSPCILNIEVKWLLLCTICLLPFFLQQK